SELDTPLVECLDLFDASNSTIQPRSLIETYGGWSKTDVEKLKLFMATNYTDGSNVDWKLAGIYMNVRSFEWLTARWTDKERDRMKDLIEQHMESTTILELVDIIKRELPARLKSDISIFSRQYVHELKAGRMNMNQMIQMRELVAEYGDDWDRIGKALGVPPSRARPLDDRVNSVTSEVQRLIKSNGAVDWSQVRQTTGLGMHECLELSQYDVGKTSWDYRPDSFSHSMVDRMTSFIEEYYPAAVPVNSRAVSNFMWVAMGDCIRIHNMFQGKFTWTDAEYAQAEALRAQGLTFKEVARRVLESTLLTRSYQKSPNG
ncbi:hypothetical protein GGI13_006364, partial [Coemansia sp. RSA 455]